MRNRIEKLLLSRNDKISVQIIRNQHDEVGYLSYDVEKRKYLLELYEIRLSRLDSNAENFSILKELTDNLALFSGDIVKITKVTVGEEKEYFIVTDLSESFMIGYIP